MNCRNCGAAMVLSSTQSYSQCLHCGTFFFPERQDEGVSVLGGPSETHACPECSRPLSPATLDSQRGVYFCTNCRGILLPRPVFAGVLQNRRAWATQPPAPPVPLNPAELERKAVCPSCFRRMTTHPYHGPGNIVIDACETCHLIWLGPDELARAVNAPGRDRGSALRHPAGAAESSLHPAFRGSGADDEHPKLGMSGRIDLLSLLDDLF